MDRRDFLKTGIATSTAGLAMRNCEGSQKSDPLVERVKQAMLAMQRASWEQGVAAQAMLEWGDWNTLVLMAHDAVTRQTGEGRLGVIYGMQGSNDPAANGEAVIETAKRTGDKRYQEAADRMLDYLMNRAPRTDQGVLCHFVNSRLVWIDSIYMAPPFLAAAGQFEEAVRQIEGFRKILWIEEKQLFAHLWDDAQKIFTRKDTWGVGNGWAAAGMARIIRLLPLGMDTERRRLTGYLQAVLDGCLKYMRPDGLFHDVLDNPDSFVETNLSQMLAYTIYRGVAGGWLEAAYLEKADRMRQAAHTKVDQFGLVQDVCGSPNFDRPGTATEGQAFFILMEAAHRDYLNFQYS